MTTESRGTITLTPTFDELAATTSYAILNKGIEDMALLLVKEWNERFPFLTVEQARTIVIYALEDQIGEFVTQLKLTREDILSLRVFTERG